MLILIWKTPLIDKRTNTMIMAIKAMPKDIYAEEDYAYSFEVYKSTTIF